MNNDRRTAGIALALLLILVGFSAWQFSIFQANKVTAEAAYSNTENFRSIQEQLLEDHQTLKARVQTTRRETEQNLSLVFPTDESLTGLTRMLDDFASRNHFSENPFFIDSIDYGASTAVLDGSAQALPFTLHVNTSRKNLERFFDFVDESGTLAGGTRLLSIESIDLSYPKEFNAPFDATLNMRAYFSRPLKTL